MKRLAATIRGVLATAIRAEQDRPPVPSPIEEKLRKKMAVQMVAEIIHISR